MTCKCGCGGIPKKGEYLTNHRKRGRARIGVRLDTGCWEWKGSLNAAGYGIMRRGPDQLAHRISFRWFRGPIPEGLHSDHLCRNRKCVNPWHLELVSNTENVWRGALAKLSKKEVAEIRERLNGMHENLNDICSSLAVEFGVSKSAIHHIHYERTWKGCGKYLQ